MKKPTTKDWNKCYEEDRVFSPVSELILDNFALQGKVLDVGCGRGQLMEQLKQRGLSVRGIDLSKYSADMVGDFLKTDVGKYDVIIANKVIAFNEIEPFLDKVKKHLTPKGRFILITPIRYTQYADKYSNHYNSISVSYEELMQTLYGKFLIDGLFTNYFDKYGVELIVSCK